MKRMATLVAMVGFLALALGSPTETAEPMAPYCTGVRPICVAATPVCACNNMGQNCQWVCVK